MPEPSSLKLAEALEKARLIPLACRARRDEFHDFRSPHQMPAHELVKELRKIGGRHARAIMERVKAGEFDATKAESDTWIASPEGQAVMRDLMEGR